jgi:molecular chaperone GrpE (heat shock protein)
MTDIQLEIQAAPRTLPPGLEVDTPIFSLAWQATQRWSEEIRQMKESRDQALERENQAWIVLADECFRWKEIYDSFGTEMEKTGLCQGVKQLVLTLRRLKQTLKSHKVEIVAPKGEIYSTQLSEMMENVGQVIKSGIQEPVIQELLEPIIKHDNRVIRFGKAIIAVPE